MRLDSARVIAQWHLTCVIPFKSHNNPIGIKLSVFYRGRNWSSEAKLASCPSLLTTCVISLDFSAKKEPLRQRDKLIPPLNFSLPRKTCCLAVVQYYC